MIHGLLTAAYALESRRIGVSAADFPPLARTVEDIIHSDSEFHVLIDDGAIVGVIELEPPREPADAGVIASLAVAPVALRRGFGRALVAHALDHIPGRLLVSTAAANRPAIALYEAHGFRVRRRYRSPEGLPLVDLTLKR